MITEQKSQISALRAQGCGYANIAKAIGLKKDTVKSFCRRNGIAGIRAVKQAEQQNCCPQCGKKLIQAEKQKPRRFCSAKCRQAWWNAHQDLVKQKAVYSYVCPTCGKPFTAYGNSHRKYCSHQCYVQARFQGSSAT
jgi:endogenous inhibitor of DNA gyrase (YacG/DUF329 family)